MKISEKIVYYSKVLAISNFELIEIFKKNRFILQKKQLLLTHKTIFIFSSALKRLLIFCIFKRNAISNQSSAKIGE